MNINEISVTYAPSVAVGERQKVRTSQDAFDLLWSWWTKDKIHYCEKFVVMYLDRAAGVMGILEHTTGTEVATIVSLKQILAVCMKINASSILVAHNHPSGKLSPSQSDILLTDKLKKACQLMEVQFLDHLIISPDGRYYSFADEDTTF